MAEGFGDEKHIRPEQQDSLLEAEIGPLSKASVKRAQPLNVDETIQGMLYPEDEKPKGKRWYDHDPTLSMAVSLIQNTDKVMQRRAVEQALRQFVKHCAENPEMPPPPADLLELDTGSTLRFLFLKGRRNDLDIKTWQMLEWMKHLPPNVQQNMAFHIIHALYCQEYVKEQQKPYQSNS